SIKIEDRIYTSLLKVIDTTPPMAESVNYTAMKNEIIAPEAFISNIVDSSNVSIKFKEIPDTSIIGDQEVVLILEDASNNVTEITTKLTIVDILNSITLEAGFIPHLTTKDFVKDEGQDVSFVTDLSTIDMSKPASHIIQLNINGTIKNAGIQILDTIPPTATVVNQEVWIGDTIEADAFVTDIVDKTLVHASFLETPDFARLGEHQVKIILEDEGHNITELDAVLTISKDEEAPRISGVKDRTIFIGETLSYRNGISVTDNKDDEVELQIDSSSVNLKKEGIYKVIYTAEDSSGNKAEKVANITVEALLVSSETLNKLSDGVLDNIINDNMTLKEKAKKIYTWTKANVGYTGNSDKSDWMAEAYRGFKNGVGDCFTYFAVSKALLDRAQIPNIDLTRLGGTTRHYWSLINCGEGWYHFDSCPNKDKKDSFYLTESEVERLTELRGKNYYVYDKTLIDVTPVE
ncbi:MAG TPA: DUF5011 domain-containing protein, partial [Clostridiales bacterium]|nr:DUF5011 domain-containing protein [Clostridiales bacterium]